MREDDVRELLVDLSEGGDVGQAVFQHEPAIVRINEVRFASLGRITVAVIISSTDYTDISCPELGLDVAV